MFIFLWSQLQFSQRSLSSSETNFVEKTSKGLTVVPASCPSDPHYAGDCSSECSPSYFCSSNDVVFEDVECEQQAVRTCMYPESTGCSQGACLPPASIVVTHRLEAKPSIVAKHTSTNLFWNIANVVNCSITSTNGDRWDFAASPNSGTPAQHIFASAPTVGAITKPLTGQTIYTLRCSGLPGAVPSSYSESITVNLIPKFQEI